MSRAAKDDLTGFRRASTSSLEVRYRDADHCIGWLANVQLILSRQPPTSEFMRRIISELNALANDLRCGTGALLIIRAGMRPPSEEARRFIQAELARSAMLGAAQVVEGSGFTAAAMRAALSMLQLVARPPYPMKVFSDIPQASGWLCQELAERAHRNPDPRELADVALELRSAFLMNPSVRPP